MPRCFLIDVAEPCLVGWDNMQGNDYVRACSLCNKNVFNLSNMTEDEVANIFEVEGNRICVSIRKRADGTLYTDNCPRRLRQFRNFLRANAPVLLVLLAWIFSQTVAEAQGLVGAPIEGRFGQSNEVGGFTDCYGYDTARDLSRCATGLSVVLTGAIAWWRIGLARRKAFQLALGGACVRDTAKLVRRPLVWGIGLVIAIPLLLHLISTYCINNYGGLTSGL